MNQLGKLSLSAVLGILAGALPVYCFMEARIERRVTDERTLAALVEKHATLVGDVQKLGNQLWEVSGDAQATREEFLVYKAKHP